MSEDIKKNYTALKIFLLSIFTFILNSCENIKLPTPKNSDDSSSCNSGSSCKLFITNSQFDGNLGGVSGADQKCQNDSANPGSGTYKALIRTSSRYPRPSGSSDWVLKASTEYTRLDGTVISNTTADGYFDPYGTLTNSFDGGVDRTSWIGVDYAWNNQANCNDWASNSGLDNGYTGSSSSVGQQAWQYGSYDCSQSRSIICVQQ